METEVPARDLSPAPKHTLSRYASKNMTEIWSEKTKYETWRKLWACLAETQMELGLTCGNKSTPLIAKDQVDALKKNISITPQQIGMAETYEKKFKHDVMAHIHAYGDVAPEAKGIIHLGATSCYVTDNTDLILMRDALELIKARLIPIIHRLGTFANEYKVMPTVAFTHFQPAQLTTVGKRASLWCYDLITDLEEVENRIATLLFRGIKGATGTQDSFLKLFHGNHEHVRKLEQIVAEKMGFHKVYPVTGQTYSRKVDSRILDTLSHIAQSSAKFATDMRLLQNKREMMEPFDTDQVGSSAMPYKRNPILAERICGLSRFVINLASNGSQTACNQWLERTLDDSSNRRLTLPQAFLVADSILCIYLNIVNGLDMGWETIHDNVTREMPFIVMETALMKAVKRGGDRQNLHEELRKLSISNKPEKLLDAIKSHDSFKDVINYHDTDKNNYIGRSGEQVEEFVESYITPIRNKYPHLLNQVVSLTV